MPDAKFRMSLDGQDVHAELGRVRQDAEQTAQAVTQSFSKADISKFVKQGDFRNASEAQRFLAGLDPSRIELGGRPLSPVPPRPQLVPPPPAPVPPETPEMSPARWQQHSAGLMQMSHSARAVADTMLYRVNPGLGEVHRTVAGMLMMSGNGMLMLAAVGLSAATVIGVQLFGSFLKAQQAAKELGIAYERLALSPSSAHPDVSGLSAIAEKNRKEAAELRNEARELEVKSFEAQRRDERIRAAGIIPLANPGGIAIREAGEKRREAAKRELAAQNAQDVIDRIRAEQANRDVEERDERERNTGVRSDIQRRDAMTRFGLDLARQRLVERTRLREEERHLALDDDRARLERARELLGLGGITTGAFQEQRREMVERRFQSDLAGADERAAAERGRINLERARLQGEIDDREARFRLPATDDRSLRSPLVSAMELRKVEDEIAERKREQIALEQELGNVEQTRLQARKAAEQEYGNAIARDIITRTREGREMDDALFNLRRSRREADLQDEIGYIEAKVAREREGTLERIRLETELANKRRELRDQTEAGASAEIRIATEEYAKQLKAAGVQNAESVARRTPLTDEQISRYVMEAGLRSEATLRTSALGGAVSPEARESALDVFRQTRGLKEDLRGGDFSGLVRILKGAEGQATAPWERLFFDASLLNTLPPIGGRTGREAVFPRVSRDEHAELRAFEAQRGLDELMARSRAVPPTLTDENTIRNAFKFQGADTSRGEVSQGPADTFRGAVSQFVEAVAQFVAERGPVSGPASTGPGGSPSGLPKYIADELREILYRQDQRR